MNSGNVDTHTVPRLRKHGVAIPPAAGNGEAAQRPPRAGTRSGKIIPHWKALGNEKLHGGQPAVDSRSVVNRRLRNDRVEHLVRGGRHAPAAHLDVLMEVVHQAWLSGPRLILGKVLPLPRREAVAESPWLVGSSGGHRLEVVRATARAAAGPLELLRLLLVRSDEELRVSTATMPVKQSHDILEAAASSTHVRLVEHDRPASLPTHRPSEVRGFQDVAQDDVHVS
eukprot:1465800-Pyramimonas_sp.AAC.1